MRPRLMSVFLMAGLLPLLLLVLPRTAAAANAECISCHDPAAAWAGPIATADFEGLAPVAKSRCRACHWIGGHPNHYTRSVCTGCHTGWPARGPLYVSTYVDPRGYGIFWTAASPNSDAATLHAIHNRGSWPARLAPNQAACASCHAPVACEACHGAASAHTGHADTAYAKVTGTVAAGAPAGSLDARGLKSVPGGARGADLSYAASQGCIREDCHSVAGRSETTSRAEESAAAYPAGTWSAILDPASSAGGIRESKAIGATASFTFSGTGVSWIGRKTLYGGWVQVTVDGTDVATVNCQAQSAIPYPRQELYRIRGLVPGTHTLTLRILPNPTRFREAYTVASIDAFDVLAGPSASGELAGKTCADACHADKAATHGYDAGVHTYAGMGASCQAAGCHPNGLADAHQAFVGTGNRYPQYGTTCELCHQNDEAGRVSIDTATAACSSCHGSTDHEAAHAVQRGDSCVACHLGASLTSVHLDGTTLTCASCHSSADPKVTAAIAGNDRQCVACHDAPALHGDMTAIHTASPGSGSVRVFNEHEGTPIDWWVECSACHTSSNLLALHSNDCAACHASGAPRTSFTTWNKSCQQGGCHVTKHENPDASHNSFDCEAACHESDWSVWLGSCQWCHQDPAPTPIATTSDARTAYIGPAVVNLTATGANGVVDCYYRIDGGAITAGRKITVPAPLAGTQAHAIEFWSVDWAGTEEVHKTASFSVTADTSAPVTTSDAKPSYVGPGKVTLQVTDNGTCGPIKTCWRLDGGAVNSGLTVNVPQPASGTAAHTLQFWSEDLTGNVEGIKTAAFTSTADLVAPVTNLTLSPYVKTTYVYPTLAVTDAAPSSGVSQVYVTSTNMAYMGAPYVTFGTTWSVYLGHGTQGPHSFTYWATDKAGNIEGARTANYIADWTAPTTTSNALAAYIGDATITFTPSDIHSGIASTQYRVDTGALQGGTSVTVPAPVVGSQTHTVYFYSTDRAGNVETTKSKTFTVTARPDAVAPTTVSDLQPSYTGPAAITLTAVDNAGGSGVAHTYYRLDAAGQAEGTSIYVPSPPSGSATHTLEFWSEDAAGNVEMHASAEFVVNAVPDTTPPTTTSNAQATYNGSATIGLTATDNAGGSGVAHTYYRLDTGGQTEGVSVTVPEPASGSQAHTLEFWSVDGSGNEETPHNSVAFTVSKYVPQTGALELAWYAPPGSWAEYWVYDADGALVAQGYDETSTGWDGFFWIPLPVDSRPYHVDTSWWDSDWGEGTSHNDVLIDAPGKVVTWWY